MTHFFIAKDDNTFHIECLFTVYRARFGHHPSFLPQDEERGQREGFNTKFFYLIKDDLTKEQAEDKLKQYQHKYDNIITQIEDDCNLWDTFPFKNNELIYYK